MNYDRWKTRTPKEDEHLPECNCGPCHAHHIEMGMVVINATLHPKDYQCCVDEMEEWKTEGKVCPRHPFSYAEPGYCEACLNLKKNAHAA